MPSFAEVKQFMSGQVFTTPQLPTTNLANKTLIITGANTGLGFACAQHLCNLGVSELIFGCRTVEKGEVARDTILKTLQSTSKPIIKVWDVDLTNYESVVKFTKRAQAELKRLDGVVANAGIELAAFETSEGLERTLTVNVVSTFLMSILLLPKLRETAKSFDVNTNLSIVGTSITIFAPFSQLVYETNTDILEELSNSKTADMGARYPLSKLIVHLCARELAKAVSSSTDKSSRNVIVNHVNPGWCRSDLFRNRGKDLPSRILLPIIGRSCETGSRNFVYAVTAGKETQCCYLSECRIRMESEWVRSDEGEQVQDRMWEQLLDRLEVVVPSITEILK